MKNTKEIKFMRMRKRIIIYVRKNKIISVILGGTIIFAIINIILILNFMTILGKI